MTAPFRAPSISDVLGAEPMPSFSISPLNPILESDRSGFFSSAFSAATREQIGMSPPADVQRYRNENPIRGFTSQVLPEIAMFAPGLPGMKLAAIAVRNIRPLATMVRYGTELKKTSPFLGGFTELTGEIAPVLAARQIGSLFAPEEGSAQRIAERNLTDIVFGGTFAGTAEFLRSFRGAQASELLPGRNEPFKSLAAVQRYFKNEIDLNNPAQDQYAALQRIMLDPANAAHPILPDVRRAAELMRAEVLTQTADKGRQFVSDFSHRKGSSVINTLWRTGKLLTESKDPTTINAILPRDFEAFSKYPRELEVFGQAERAKTWRALTDNLEQLDKDTFVKQENSEGLFVVVKKIHSQEAGQNKLFVGRPDLPDRYLLVKTSKPWEFTNNRGQKKVLEDLFANDPHYTQVSDSGFLDTPQKIRGTNQVDLSGEGAVASVLPGNTPTDDSIARVIALAKPWQKGMYGVGEATGQLETPEFLRRIGNKLSQTLPSWVPFSQLVPKAVVGFSHEAGHIIRETAQTSRAALSPATSQFTLNRRAQVLNILMRQSFHDMLGRVRQDLWGKIPDSALEGNYIKNILFSRHDPREGGILNAVVRGLSDITTKKPDEAKLLDFSRTWQSGWSPEEAAERGVGSEVVDTLKAIRGHDQKGVIEIKAQRAKLGLKDDFIPMENHYAMSRMWEGHHRVELFDELTGKTVGYAGGKRPAAAMERAKMIVERFNAEDNGGKLMTPIREHMSTTDYLRYNKELATDASAYSREVDAVQRGAKLDASNFMVQKVIQTVQKLRMEDPMRFAPRHGAVGFTGQFEPLSLKEILETLTANTMETQRLLTKESLIARLGPELTKLANEFPDMHRQFVIRFNSHLGYQGPVAKQIDAMIDKPLARFMGAHGASRAVRTMNSAIFGLTFAGDAGFLAVNSMTGIQTLLPEASLLMNAPSTARAPWYSVGLLATSKGFRPASFLDPIKATGQAFKELIKLSSKSDPDLLADVMKARELGAIDRSIVNEIEGFGAEAAGYLKSGNPIVAALRFGEHLIRRTEEFSRLWAFITGRKIALDFLNQSREQAFETARTFVSRTMYEYTAGDRARVTTGAVGSGWGLFKNWPMHYMSNLMAYSDEAVYKNNWGPLLWAMIGTGSVGGAVAMPAYGVANGMANLLADKDLLDFVYEAADYGGKPGRVAADGLAYGLPSLLGYTFQGRASAPASQVIRDTSMFFNMAVVDRAKGLYSFFGNVADQWGDGNMNALNDPRVQRSFMQAFSPRTLQRAYTYWGHEGLDSLKTGNRLVNKVSKTDAFMHALGLTTLEVERSFDMSAELFENTNKLRARIQFYGESYSQAWQGSDYPEMSRIYRRLWDEGIPIPSVLRSATSRIQKDQGDLLDRQHDEQLVRRIKRLRGG